MKSSLFGLLVVLLLVGTGCAQLGKKGCREGCDGGCNECGMRTALSESVNAHGEPCPQAGDFGSGFGSGSANSGYAAGGPGGYGGPGGHAGRGHFKGPQQNPRAFNGPSGPPTAQVTYPYYTVRGPRDFLLDDPQTIGP
ncbi:MAG: hypothetical protein N2C12_00435 [Planctomycetales bacterium]